MADQPGKVPLSKTQKRRLRHRKQSNFRANRGEETAADATCECLSEVDEQLKNTELIRAVKSILESLTPETFHSSLRQLKKLKLDTEEKLQEVVNLIFEGAVMGRDSAKLFARLCSSLPKVQFQSTADSTAFVSFNVLLGRRCRAEYETIFGKDNGAGKRQRVREDDATLGRSIGTITFIGELFLTHILNKAVMHSCISGLLKNQDDVSLECLCELLQIIGMNLEMVTAKQVMNSYYDRMLVIAKNEKTPSRISLMLKTTTDPYKREFLSLTGRVHKTKDKASVSPVKAMHLMPQPRTPPAHEPKEQPQVLPMVDEEPEPNVDETGQEKEQIHSVSAQPEFFPTVDGETQFNLDEIGQEKAKIHLLSGLWDPSVFGTVVSCKEQQQFWHTVDVKPEINMDKFGQEKEKIHLLPGPWEPGVFDPVDSTKEQQQFLPSVDEEPHLHLDEFGQEKEKIEQLPGQSEPGVFGPVEATEEQRQPSPSVDEEPPSNVDKSEEDKEPELSDDQTGPAIAAPAQPVITEGIESFSEMVIVNYLRDGNLGEALNCVAEQMNPSLLHVFVRSAVDLTFDGSSESRRKMGQLLHWLHEAGVLPAEQIVKGLQDTLETAAYIDKEVPNIWRCLAEVINPSPHKGASLLMSCLETSHCSHLLKRLVC